jgi:hypothetical protein
LNKLERLFASYEGYNPAYYDCLKNRHLRYKNVLDISCKENPSHLVWKEYFPNATIYKIDDFRESLERSFLNKKFSDVGFDMIVDNCSHMSWDQQETFYNLWDKLNSGGFYFIEKLGMYDKRESREFDDVASSSFMWAKSINTDNPFSYYMPEDWMRNINKEIDLIRLYGDFLVIKKKDIEKVEKNQKSVKTDAFFVVSEYNNMVDWVEEYTKNYVIYDKSDSLPIGEKILKVNNVGFNIWDIFHFITTNYDNLPDLVAFLEGDPWHHCNRKTFNKLITKKELTPLESYKDTIEYWAHKHDEDGGFLEINTSHYLALGAPYKHRYFSSFDMFMENCFVDYEHIKWLRFAPGGMYLVPKENILFYSKAFYEKIMTFVDYDRLPVEAFLIERALYLIFSNKFTARI